MAASSVPGATPSPSQRETTRQNPSMPRRHPRADPPHPSSWDSSWDDEVQARQGPRRARPRRRRANDDDRAYVGDLVDQRWSPRRRPKSTGGVPDVRGCRREGVEGRAGRRVAARVLVHLRGRTTGLRVRRGSRARRGRVAPGVTLGGMAGLYQRLNAEAAKTCDNVHARVCLRFAHPGVSGVGVAGTLVRGGRVLQVGMTISFTGVTVESRRPRRVTGIQSVRRAGRVIKLPSPLDAPAEGGEGRAHERRRAFGKLRDDVRGCRREGVEGRQGRDPSVREIAVIDARD